MIKNALLKMNARPHTLWVVALVLSGALLSSCMNVVVKQEEDVSEFDEVVIATFDPQSDGVKEVFKKLLRETFEDGVPIVDVRVEKQGGFFYLIREGKVDGSCRISRTRLLSDENTGQIFLKKKKKTVTHTCTGVECQACELIIWDLGKDKQILGCACQVSAPGKMGYCNHTITTTTDKLLREIRPTRVALHAQ